jgi:hypothetical protein
MARLEVEYDQLSSVTNALGPLVEEFNAAAQAFNNQFQAMTWQGQAANAAIAAVNNATVPQKLVATARYMNGLQEALNNIIKQVQQNDDQGANVMNSAMGDGSV